MAISRVRVAQILENIRGLSIAVVGDVCLDEYLIGVPERLSREAPVPVLTLTRRFTLPGGAANPARNIAALGGSASQVGLVGDDDAGRALIGSLSESGIDVSGIVVDALRPTTTKTRVIADGGSVPYQVARIDDQSRASAEENAEARLIAALDLAVEGAQALLVSDYKSGVVTEAVRDAARLAAADAGIWLTVDSQGDLDRFTGFDLIRAARRDIEAYLRRELRTEDEFESATTLLRDELRTRLMIVSRGAAGMSVADATGYSVVPAANVSEVFDVTGAGDTVIAVLTAALAAGAEVSEAVELANRAAGIVVRRLGVAAPTPSEVLGEFAG